MRDAESSRAASFQSKRCQAPPLTATTATPTKAIFRRFLPLTQRRVAVGVLCFALLCCTCNLSRLAPLAHAAAQQQATASPVEVLSGEYTDPNEPDTPISFYTENGKLIMESERMVPTSLN